MDFRKTMLSVGSLSSDVFERRTSTGSEVFSLLTCLDDIKFVFLSFFTVIEAIWLKICAKPPSKNEKRPLPVDVRRSKTLLLKLPSVLFPPQRPLCIVGRLGREKRERAADVSALLLFFDYGYQAGTTADERGECDNRGAEIIWNKRRTLFIQVRIALMARLIITLTLKSEGEILRCYRSNQTSLVKRLHSTTYFLHFTKRNLNSHANFFRPPSGLLGMRGLKF